MIIKKKVNKKNHPEENKMSFESVIFDLDGVITNTAKTHASAWKKMLDDLLKEQAFLLGEPFLPFNIDTDYPAYVDGKPRNDGISSFLESRNIRLPLGQIDDNFDQKTICGLSNKKNKIFTEILDREGVEVFETTIRLIKDLKDLNIPCGIVSSSKNCQRVIQKVDIEDLFLVRVDGMVSLELNLKGKPDPDIFIKCAELMNVEIHKTVVVEDAISGVQAARDGNFGLVIGLDRMDIAEELKNNGAMVVINDFLNIYPSDINEWFLKKENL